MPTPGGLSRGSLTEVVGPAGVGKSQLCLTMCACAGLPEALGGLGEGTGVLFLDTEQKFSPHRLQEIAKQQVGLLSPLPPSPRLTPPRHTQSIPPTPFQHTPQSGTIVVRRGRVQ